jgi:predicted RNase H-like nuclease
VRKTSRVAAAAPPTAPLRVGIAVAGADVFSRGWIVVYVHEDGRCHVLALESFAEVAALDANVIAVDIPIGLPEDRVGRPADSAARAFVGARSSSVFPTPPRAALLAPDYARAREIATKLTGKSLSAQSFALAKRILEVEPFAETDERIVEVHPEASFRELAGVGLEAKKTQDGQRQRRVLLEAAGFALPPPGPGFPEPDLLDAAVAAWSAARYANREALPLPEDHSQRIGAIWR